MARAAFDLSRCAGILPALLSVVLAAPLVASEEPSGINSFQGRWIDLSHSFSEDTIYWPTACGFEKTVEFRGMNPKGYFPKPIFQPLRMWRTWAHCPPGDFFLSRYR